MTAVSMNKAMPARVVIAGGGLAAVRTAQSLRDLEYEGEIVLISDEPDLPYDRPPLSKEFLTDDLSSADVALLDESELAALRLDLRLGQAATGLDLESRTLVLAGGEAVLYDKLVVATGASPVRLPMLEELSGVYYLRDLRDAIELRTALAAGPRLGIVGGGFIGLEVAASAVAMGCEVSVVEAAEAPLAAVVGVEVGHWFRQWHEEMGVSFTCGGGVTGVEGGGAVEALAIGEGGRVEVDLALVCAGVRPTVSWLADSGIELHRGLVCDADRRTSDPHVFGVGDATCRHTGGACVGTGHWTAATEHARIVAATLMGQDAGLPFSMEYYFWSDQYGKRLQFAGRVDLDSSVSVETGSVAARKFAATFGDPGAPAGVLALDEIREFNLRSMAMRRGAGASASG